jgi:hypothetical protein
VKKYLPLVGEKVCQRAVFFPTNNKNQLANTLSMIIRLTQKQLIGGETHGSKKES